MTCSGRIIALEEVSTEKDRVGNHRQPESIRNWCGTLLASSSIWTVFAVMNDGFSITEMPANKFINW
jgi:hypothetical protein